MATKGKKQSSSDGWIDAEPEARGLLPFVGIALTLGVWYVLTYFSTGVLANFAPQEAFVALVDLLTNGEFYTQHVRASMTRFAGALALSLVVGLPLGILVGYFDVAERLSSVSFQFLRMISPVAWFPVALLTFESGGHAAPIFIMFMGGVWPLVFNTAHGIKTLDDDWLKVADSLGGTTRTKIRKVVIPGVIPDMITGLRLSIGWLWILLVPAEYLGVNSGMGYFILNARQQFSYAEIPAVMIVIGLIGFTLDLTVRKLRGRWSWR
ncbi:ABC transporter permease [Haladaptatus sp. F3-133]|jgi:NitT/TauT family transport system permease protein|uniref:ABC transporter permease n=1 Tax=Halorutilus salinus TaxID=2487751 RepID=A0A9Q4C4P9_9EURY|nr:ABC transporter permease [Halorutilus salinus]MCX2818980.1 ABC transporter permease [Halorutilus salinus]